MPASHRPGDIERSIAFMNVSDQYLRLATAAARSIRESGNQCLSSPGVLTHDEQTYYCDQNIGVAIVFNLFHGIEVWLKALLQRAGQSEDGHNIPELLKACQAAYPAARITELVHQYFPSEQSDSGIACFFKEQGLAPLLWYQMLKYPETTRKLPVHHLHIKFSFHEQPDFWENLVNAYPRFRNVAEEAVK